MNTKAIVPKLARKKRYDLPLHRGSGGQLVAWIVGVMSYLTVLMMVLVFALNAAEHYWQAGLTGRMTLEIPYDRANPVSEQDKQALTQKLNNLDGIKARVLTLDDMGTLVGPWLGDKASLAELPMPTLVDIAREDSPGAASDAQIQKAARQIISSATLDTHEEWLADLMQLAQACRMILIVISFILAITSALTVAATARTRLALHKEEVDLLHLIGATDAYIATQFQRQAFRLATEGAAGGLALALVTMTLISLVKRHLGDTLVPQFSMTWVQWVCLLLTPLLAGVIAMIASRYTILRALKKMP